MVKDCWEEGCDCGCDMARSLPTASKLLLWPTMARLCGGAEDEKDLWWALDEGGREDEGAIPLGRGAVTVGVVESRFAVCC